MNPIVHLAHKHERKKGESGKKKKHIQSEKTTQEKNSKSKTILNGDHFILGGMKLA